MLIACASDAHGAREKEEALLAALPAVDALCFLGDCEEDALRLRWALAQTRPATVFHAVRGNCDLFSRLPATLELTFGPVKTLATHGHLFRVKLTEDLLAQAARERGCGLALFGHTHRPLQRATGGVLLVNPGALAQGQWALVEIGASGEVDASLRAL